MQMILITNMGYYSSTLLTRISTPRFLGKKRGKGYTSPRQSSQTRVDLLSWRGLSTSSWNFNFFLRDSCSTELKERGNNYRKMDLWEDWVSHGQLMEWVFVNISWANKHETPESVRRDGKVSNLIRQVVSTFEWYSQTIKREALVMRYGCSKGRLRYRLLFL
jgi:hypothetical protein